MNAESNWQIGQVVPFEAGRGVQGEPDGNPQWFAFITPPQKERAAKAWLEIRGVDSWFPTEIRWRRVPRAKVQRVKYEGTCVPRYLFVRFSGQPNWDVLRTCRYLSGVVGRYGKPLPISDETLAEMADVPSRLAEMKRARIAASTINPGDKVRIEAGPMQGWVVDVSAVSAGIAKFMVPLLGQSCAQIAVSSLSKIVEKKQGLA